MAKRINIKTRLMMERVGESIGTWRRLRNISSQELADRCNVSRTTISKLENGDPTVALSTFLTASIVLGINKDILEAIDPWNSDIGRLRAGQELPQKVRKPRG